MDLIADHGSAKQAEPGDPLDLVGTIVPGGDLELLARCFIEEFAAMGYDGDRLLELFRQPQYVAVHPVYRAKGEAATRRLIDDVLGECGVFCVQESIPDESSFCKPGLVQIRTSNGPEDERL